jgi:hypothetical protein
LENVGGLRFAKWRLVVASLELFNYIGKDTQTLVNVLGLFEERSLYDLCKQVEGKATRMSTVFKSKNEYAKIQEEEQLTPTM